MLKRCESTWKMGMTSSRMALRKPSSALAGGPRRTLSMLPRTAPQAVATTCKLEPRICSASQALCSGGLSKGTHRLSTYDAAVDAGIHTLHRNIIWLVREGGIPNTLLNVETSAGRCPKRTQARTQWAPCRCAGQPRHGRAIGAAA